MRAGEGAAVFFLVLSSFAASVVAPTKSELEAMYAAAAQELNAGHNREALAKLDAIEARQPDVAAAENLRGVAWMRLTAYRKAEAALRKAREIDPDFWEARFNLAEVSFLTENWTEARRRFSAVAMPPPGQPAAPAQPHVQLPVQSPKIHRRFAPRPLSPESLAALSHPAPCPPRPSV